MGIPAPRRLLFPRNEQRAFLLKIRQRLQAVLDNTTMLIYVVTYDAKFRLINKRFEEIFHVNSAAIAGMTVHAVLDKPNRRPVISEQWQCFRDKKHHEIRGNN